jgi:hypothetical protein
LPVILRPVVRSTMLMRSTGACAACSSAVGVCLMRIRGGAAAFSDDDDGGADDGGGGAGRSGLYCSR